ncbi:hypothetical protein [Oceanisphaera ostreae]|uniref:Uncharacterized protein n=1 Tax=Oceanisphaera ostreae TaxID=914151 RepID=A0ABW3KDA5_9GAMM
MAEEVKSKTLVEPKTQLASKPTVQFKLSVEPKTIAELEAMHTGTLMNRRKALLACPETSVLPELEKVLAIGEVRSKDTAVWRQAYQDLKSVLDQREHLPSKQERKSMRQQRARRRF